MVKDYIQQFFKAIVRPQYQVVMLGITSIIVLILGARSTTRFNPLELDPEIKSISPEKVREWGGEPVTVDVGLFITNWHQFRIVENIFIFDGILWFQFDPSLISLDTIEKFSFEKGEVLQKSEPSTKLIDGKLFAEYKIRLRFTTDLSHKFFPLDDHRIYITMINTHVTPSEVIFQSYKSDFVTSKKTVISEWNQVDLGVRTGYEEESIDKFDDRKIVRYPVVVFMLDFMRSGIRLILLIFLPIFLIFFLSTFWFCFSPRDGRIILTLTISAVTSLIAYRFVIQTMAPMVGYFLLSDHIFTFFLALSFISFVFALLWIRLKVLTPTAIILRGVVFCVFHILFIVTWYLLLFKWA